MHWTKDGELGHYTIEHSELQHCAANQHCPNCNRTGTFQPDRIVKADDEWLFTEAHCHHCNAKLVVLND